MKLTSIPCFLMAFTASPSFSYPIDCAILLCLGGGFPTSAECAVAKSTMIQRVTPFPITPPVQPWNCPMGSNGRVAISNTPYDGLELPLNSTDFVSTNGLGYLAKIKLFHIDHHIDKDHGECGSFNSSRIGRINGDGGFVWQPLPYNHYPTSVHVPSECSWGTAGHYRYIVLQHSTHDGRISEEIFPY